MGYEADPLELAARRTLPVLVPLNVAQLVTEAYQDAPAEQRATMLPHVDDAAQVIYREGEEWSAQNPGPGRGCPGRRVGAAYETAADAQAQREQTAEDVLRGRYYAAFEAYAEAFTAAVLDVAREIDGLAVSVEVKAETDPEATWWDSTDTINPADDYESDDALVWHLWAAARDRDAHSETTVTGQLAPTWSNGDDTLRFGARNLCPKRLRPETRTSTFSGDQVRMERDRGEGPSWLLSSTSRPGGRSCSRPWIRPAVRRS